MPLISPQQHSIAHATQVARQRLLALFDEAKSNSEGEEHSVATAYFDKIEPLRKWALEQEIPHVARRKLLALFDEDQSPPGGEEPSVATRRYSDEIERLRAWALELDAKNVTRQEVLTLLDEVKSHTEGEVLSAATRRYSDEAERLRIWALEQDVESGALDHRLRDASVLRNRVLTLLGQLSGATDMKSPWSRSDGDEESSRIAGLETLVASTPVHLLGGDDDDGTCLSLDTDFTLPDSLSDSPLTHIHDVVNLLLGLGPTLLDPAPRDRFGWSAHKDAAHYDIDHVQASFPLADISLKERLGRANWERRQYLIGLRSKLDEGSREVLNPNAIRPVNPSLEKLKLESSASDSEVDGSDDSASEVSDLLSASSQACDSDLKNNSSTRGPLTIATSVTGPDFELTATTALTEPSKGILHVELSGVRFAIPPPPHPNEQYSGEEFLCPFCAHRASDVKSRVDWKRHIFDDLQPYMCTYTDCMLSTKTFGTKRAWWEHETQRHRTQRAWVCTPCERRHSASVFHTSASFEKHFGDHHSIGLTAVQIPIIRDMCQRNLGPQRPRDVCPLCKVTIPIKDVSSMRAAERAVRKHVSDHMEQLSFFVASSAGQIRFKDDDSEFQDDSDFEDGLQSEIKTIASKETHLSRKEIHVANLKAFIADQQKAAGDDPGGPVLGPIPPEATPVDRTSSTPTHDPDSGVPVFPVFVQVPPPNEHFYSRSNLLLDLDKCLSSSGAMCIVHGVGGVGKTLAAVQYSHVHKEQYDAVFWLHADTAPGLTDSYLEMALALGVADSPEDHHLIMAKGRNWLQETEKRWLLVFDNAVRWEDISRYMPNSLRRTRGSVLVTTQHEELLPRALNNTRIRIDPLTSLQGSDMLLRYLGRDARTDPESLLAKEISAFVGGLPVAIAHVAGYVSFSDITLEELIETFREWRKRTGAATDEADDLPATFREASFSYNGTLAMVWEVTLRELTQDARDVMNILAYLNCDMVPKTMLWGMHEDPILHFLDSREKIRMRRTHQSLTKRRLVVDHGGTFSMHRSLQRGIRERLSQDKGQQQTVFEQAVALVREVFPRPNELQQPTPDKWSECQKLLPHLHALRDVYHFAAAPSNHHIQGSLEFAQLLLDAGMDQFEQGIIVEGLLLLHTAEHVLDASSGPSPEEHQVMRANIHAMIAIMYDDIGITKREEAWKRRQTALSIRQRTFENSKGQARKDEMLVYNSWMEYAISLLHYHRFTDAEPIINKCLAKFREWGSEDKIPFEYAKYYNKIALVRMYQGRFKIAIECAQKGMELMSSTGYNMFTSRFKFDMACIVLQSGDLDRALQIHEEIHQQRIETVGPSNPLSLHSMYAIGAIHELKEDHYEAANWFQKVLDQRRTLSSWPDEAISRTQFHLARVMLAQDRPEDIETANDLREKALAMLHRLLPLDMPPELDGVTDETILFDHLMPISPGGPRFTGRGLLERFMREK